jgi:aspartate beta-hydroxylase
LKEIFDKAEMLDRQAEKLKSNTKLMEALVAYKELVVTHGDKLNDTILKEVGERCIERMRFIGRLKAAVEIHTKLIDRFDDEPRFRNQLAVTYLLGNQ